jgi:hypothetical protein
MEHIFFNQHHTATGAHRTAAQIARTLGRNYYAPNMKKTFVKFANKCYYCTVSISNTIKAHPLRSRLNAQKPREIWAFDICSGLTTTSSGHSLIHLFIDCFSLFTVLVPAKSKASEEIVTSIQRHIIQPFTAPSAIRSDGLAENRIKTVKNLIRSTLAANNGLEWDTNLYLLQAALNQTVGSNGYCPEEVMYGHMNTRPNDPLLVSTPDMPPEEYISYIKKNMEVINANVERARAAQRRNNEAFRNQGTKERKFVPGQLVYALCKVISGPSGLLCRKRGPYFVEEVSAHGQTALIREMSTGKFAKRHFHHLVPMTETRLTPKLNSNWDKSLREFQQQQQQQLQQQQQPEAAVAST